MNLVMGKWNPRRKDNTTQSLTSLYRFLLQQITSPPQRIQEYSLRLDGRSGRDAKLKNLPDEIETTLIDFADDMMGYGYDELLPGAVVDFENSE
ncbi:unnamed protein product [Cylicocyclus nassatus]|uniref:Uncharacterized protein n=1 Tax=Cylicocyclus nassatus TaxID=53992 RepID=A0AA36HDA8_CYLNA|nr:unnamed protein product [Cylicocyclus nassatus]